MNSEEKPIQKDVPIPLPDPPRPRRLTAEQKQQIWTTSGIVSSHDARLGSLETESDKFKERQRNLNERLFVLEQSLLAQIEANS